MANQIDLCPAVAIFDPDISEKSDLLQPEFRERLKEILFKEPYFSHYLKEVANNTKPSAESWKGSDRNQYTRYFQTRKEFVQSDMLKLHLQEIREAQSYKILNFLRDSYNAGNEKYSDIEVHVEDKIYMAHRIVLACYAPFIFHRLARVDRETETRKIRLSGITKEGFEPIFQYIYTGLIYPQDSNFIPVLETAFKFCMYDFAEIWFDIYEEKLGSVTARNLFRRRLAKIYKWNQYIEQLDHALASNFDNLLVSDRFLTLSAEELADLLKRDEIGVQSEMVLYVAVLKWLNHKWDARKEFAVFLMELIRFSLMDEDELLACFHPPILSEVMSIREIKGMIADALNKAIIAKRTNSIPNLEATCRPRKFRESTGPPLQLWPVTQNLT